MKFGLLISALLILNLLGALLVKYIGCGGWGVFALIALLGTLFFTYFLRIFVWMYVGRTMQLSFVYPFLGLNYIASFLIGLMLFHEDFSWMRLAGAICILFGVFILSRTPQQKDGDHAEI